MLLLLVFITYVASDRSLLISMMPLLKFLSALLFSSTFITETFYTMFFLNLPSTFLLKFLTLLHAWFLILLNFLISFHLFLIFTGYLFTFVLSSKSVFPCIKSLTLNHLPIFLTSCHLLNVLAHGPLLILSSSFSLPLIPMLKLFCFFLTKAVVVFEIKLRLTI